MRDYLITIVTATLAAWILQQGAPPPPAPHERALELIAAR